MVVAKRARQLNSYYRALGEGSYEEYTPPMVDTPVGAPPRRSRWRSSPGEKLHYHYRA